MLDLRFIGRPGADPGEGHRGHVTFPLIYKCPFRNLENIIFCRPYIIIILDDNASYFHVFGILLAKKSLEPPALAHDFI